MDDPEGGTEGDPIAHARTAEPHEGPAYAHTVEPHEEPAYAHTVDAPEEAADSIAHRRTAPVPEGPGAESESAARARSPQGPATELAPGMAQGPDRVAVTVESPGRYAVRDVLGKGGQSKVYLAHDNVLGRDIALKQPITMPGDDPNADPVLERFLREARITARLEHPNIVPIYEIGIRPDGTYYSAQKLVGEPGSEPRTLRRALSDAAGLEDRLELLQKFAAVCHAIAFAHEHGVIHRDLKPDNVVVGRLGETVVLDWGLAKIVGDDDLAARAGASPGTPIETQAGQALGTPAYMSPEQAAGRVSAIDERTDVWSLGAILYEILTGRAPYASAASPQAMIDRALAARAQPVNDLCPEAPAALAAVAKKAIARDPDDRYAAATELAHDVEAFLANAPVGVYRYSATELARLFVRRHRGLVAVAAVAAILVASAAVVAAIQYRQASIYLGESREHLAEARENLAHALVEKGRRSQARLQWDRAAAYYAAARTHSDMPEARWGARLSAAHDLDSIARFAAHEPDSSVSSLAFSPDGTLVSVGSEGTIKLWDPEERRRIDAIEEGVAINAVAISPAGDAIATGAQSGEVTRRSASGAAVETLLEHGDEIHDVAFSSDGRRIAVGTADYHVLVYDRETDRVTTDAVLDGAPVYEVAFQGDDILAAAWDGRVYRIEPSATGPAAVSSWRAHADAVLALAVSPDGTRIATGGRDNLVKIWRTGDGEPVHRLAGHTQKVYAVAFSPDGSLLASGGFDETMRLWDADSGLPLVSRSFGHGQGIAAIAFSPDGDTLAWSGDPEIWLQRLDDAAAPPIEEHGHMLATSPDGTRSLIRLRGPRDESIVVASLPDLEIMASSTDELADEEAWIGNAVAFWCEDRAATCLYDVAKGEVRHKVGQRGDASRVAARLSPDGRRLATADSDGTVAIWDTSTGERLKRLDAHTDDAYRVAFSPDGTTLATAGYEGTAALWDVSTWEERARLRGHSHGVSELAFSPDGRLVATASWDASVRVWRVDTGAQVAVLLGHRGVVRGLDFGPEGQILVSGSRDSTLRFWDVNKERQLGVFATDENEVKVTRILQGGRRVLYIGRSAHIVDLPPRLSPQRQLDRILERAGLERDGVSLERTRAPPIGDLPDRLAR